MRWLVKGIDLQGAWGRATNRAASIVIQVVYETKGLLAFSGTSTPNHRVCWEANISPSQCLSHDSLAHSVQVSFLVQVRVRNTSN